MTPVVFSGVGDFQTGPLTQFFPDIRDMPCYRPVMVNQYLKILIGLIQKALYAPAEIVIAY